MDATATLALELGEPAYASLSDAEIIAALTAPIAGTRGPLDLDWLDSLLVQYGLWPTVELAAEGTVPAPVWNGEGEQPAGSVTAQQAAGAVLAARQIRDTVRSPRQHPFLDTSLPQFELGLQVLTLCGVIAAAVAEAIRVKARVSRAQQLGCEVDDAAVARARRYRRNEGWD